MSRTWMVVVNYQSHALIERNFGAVTAGSDGTVGLVVVDNYSTTAERDQMKAVCLRHGWTFAPRDENDGFAVACNHGVQIARDQGARQVMLVNPDAVVSHSVITALAAQLELEPMTLISPVVLASTGAPYFQGIQIDLRNGRMRGRRWPDEAAGPVYLDSEPPFRDWLSGACLAFTVQLWERAGGLDDRYFLYWEDVDFSQRCVAVGARLCLRRDQAVIHDEGATHGLQGSRARSSVYYFYNCRNRLIYGMAHLTRPDLVRWIIATPVESWQILLRGGRRQLVRSPRPLWSAMRGTLAGLVRIAPAMAGIQRRN